MKLTRLLQFLAYISMLFLSVAMELLTASQGTFNFFYPVVLSFFVFVIPFIFQRIYSNKPNYLEPNLVFLAIFSLFHFSYLWFYCAGLVEYDKEVFYSPQHVAYAVNLSVMCMLAFLLGYGSPVKVSWIESTEFHLPEEQQKHNGRYAFILLLSKFLILLSILLFWVPILALGSSAFNDYKVLISVGESPLGRFYWLNIYTGVAGMAIYFSALYFLGKTIRKEWFFLGVIVFYCLSFLLIGDRAGFLSVAIIPVVWYSLLIRRISLRLIVFSALSILLISSIIAVGRRYVTGDLFEMFRYYSVMGGGSPLVEAIHEFGSTIKTVVISLYFIPDYYPFWWGRSYLDAILVVLPNLFSDSRQSIGLGNWITEIAFGPIDSTWGRGGSIVMEAYSNLGKIGAVAWFFLIGFLVKKIFMIFLTRISFAYLLTGLALYAAFAVWIRNTSMTSMRMVLWSLIIYFIFNQIYKFFRSSNIN